MDELDDPLPRGGVLRTIQPGAPRRDARLSRHIGHLGHHEPGAAHRAASQMHQMPISDRSIVRDVLTHRRNDDAVRQHEIAQPERCEHRRRQPPASSPHASSDLPLRITSHRFVDAREECRVADAQILVRDPERSRQQREGELHRVQRHVPLGVFEPLQRRLCGALQAFDLRPAPRLVRTQGRTHIRVVHEAIAQGDGIFHRHPRSGPDGEVRRVRRVAEQDDPVAPPRFDAHRRELPPDAAVRHQLMAVELLGEQSFEKVGRLLLRRAVHARGLPRRLAALDDERRVFRTVLVRVHAPEAMTVVLEVKREGGERLRRSEPDEPVRPHIDRRPDPIAEQAARGAVEAVRRDGEIGVANLGEARDLAFEQQVDARRARLFLQHAQQRVAAHAAEAVAGRRDALAAIVHLDVVPVHEVPRDAAVGLRVGVGDGRHRRIREHDAESERIVGAIAFDDADLVSGIRFLHQHGEVQTAGAAADADDPHHTNFGGRFATKAA